MFEGTLKSYQINDRDICTSSFSLIKKLEGGPRLLCTLVLSLKWQYLRNYVIKCFNEIINGEPFEPIRITNAMCNLKQISLARK